MFWIILVILVLPAILIFRGAGRANGWLYDFMEEFFHESLQGSRHAGSMSKLLALIGSIIAMVVIVAILLAIF